MEFRTEGSSMRAVYLSLVVFLVVSSLGLKMVVAQDASAALGLGTQFSSEVLFTGAEGVTITEKIYRDGDKIRIESHIQSAVIVNLIRRDKKEIYSPRPDSNLWLVSPYDPAAHPSPAVGPEGKATMVGSETLDGVACTKYQVVSPVDSKSYIWWVDAARKIPVKMISQDSMLRVVYQNYKAGPQDPALFAPPAGVRVVSSVTGMEVK
jgi:hypothetical protein